MVLIKNNLTLLFLLNKERSTRIYFRGYTQRPCLILTIQMTWQSFSFEIVRVNVKNVNNQSRSIFQGLFNTFNLFPLSLQSKKKICTEKEFNKSLPVLVTVGFNIEVYSLRYAWLLSPWSRHSLTSGVLRGASVESGAFLVLQEQKFNFE